MSGLLDLIVRRRRASASTRLGPPSQNGVTYDEVPANENGVAPEAVAAAVPEAVAEPSHEVEQEQPAANGATSALTPELEAVQLDVVMWAPEVLESATVEIEAASTQELAALPAVEAPVENAPVEEAAVVDAPIEEAAVVQAPVEEAPVEESPMEEAPVEEAPVEESPVEEAPVEELPAQDAPTGEPEREPEPGFRERGRIRRRARYLRQLRELQLRDIGGFILELHRYGRERPDLVGAKISVAAETDRELRGLERALGEQHHPRELREAGIGGACMNCGAVHGSADRYCASCGAQLPGNAADSAQSGDEPTMPAEPQTGDEQATPVEAQDPAE